MLVSGTLTVMYHNRDDVDEKEFSDLDLEYVMFVCEFMTALNPFIKSVLLSYQPLYPTDGPIVIII